MSYDLTFMWFLLKTIMLAAVADVLIDAALVLGGDATLKILYMKLIEVYVAPLILSILKLRSSATYH